MSKKKFKKFKKKHAHQTQYVAPVQTAVTTPIETEVMAEIHDEPEVVEKVEAKTAPMLEETEAEKKEYGYVRKDVRKILIVIGSIFILLFVAYCLSLKTPIFNSMGNWLYNTLNIQTQ